MAHAFFLGVDFDEASEDSVDVVLTILEKEQDKSEQPSRFRLDHARAHTVESTEALAEHIQGLVADRPYIGRTNVVVNRSEEAGQALVEALQDRGMDPIAATLTGGSGTVAGGTDEVGVHLGAVDAVRTLAELYRDGSLEIEDHGTEAVSELARGVQRAAEVLDEADGDQSTPEASGSTLDGLGDVGAYVISAALAAWCGTERSFDPSQHLKENPQTGRPGEAGR